MRLDDCADWIIVATSDDARPLSMLKLQKLAYYAQAWHLAIHGVRLFEPGQFEAWVHGPASRPLFDRFRAEKARFSALTLGDLRPGFDVSSVDESSRSHLEEVLDAYAGLSGLQLETLSQSEDPWIAARGGLAFSAACATPIDDDLIRRFYAARLS